MYNNTMDPDPIWAKILDQDPNSMYRIWLHNTDLKNLKVLDIEQIE